jgi:DNA-binding SARP family transcriptional activator/tetratricopeptide (TPR) repeat protein
MPGEATEGSVRFGLLGPLEVRVGDGHLRLGGAKQRALLALLLLHANRVLTREQLIDELWEDPPGTVVKALQVHVSQLRKLLPDGLLVSRSPGYVLEVDPESIDLVRFERLVAEARGREPEQASALLGGALSLWRGPALADLGSEPFVRSEAGRLEDMRQAAVEERIESDLALGRHADLVGELETLIERYPHRERPRGQLMLALYRSGRQADALQAYRDARAALAELGIEPGSSLRRIEKRILTQDGSLDLVPRRLLRAGGEHVALPGALAPESPFPFVGRSSERQTLRELLERTETGEGGLVLLSGEAGGGKTRLLRELAHEASAQEMLVLYGTSDAEVATPYQPLREWLEFLLRVYEPTALAEALRGAGERLSRLVPDLESLTGTPAPSPRDVESDPFILQGAAVELLRRLSLAQPLVLLVDDMHWADGGTLQFLRRLARSAPEGRILLVTAYRDRGEEIASTFVDALADLSRLDGVTRLPLSNLTAEEVGTFIRASTAREAAPELVTAIRELTEGTPLLLCELWRDLSESGAADDMDAARLARAVAELHGSGRIRDVVQQRLSRLTPETAAAVELAAVAGPQFELRILAEAAGLDRSELVGVVEGGVQSGILEELPGLPSACRFTHELVRRAVYERITAIRRAELHLRIGEALESADQADTARTLAELAHHFTFAVPLAGTERAVHYSLRAAEAVIATAAYAEGAALLETALELGISDPRERVHAQVELGYLLQETGRVSQADAVLAESLAAATELEERGIAAHALMSRLGNRLADPELDLEESRRRYEEVIATFTQLGDERGLGLARRYLGITLNRLGQTAAGTAQLERALAHAEASGDPPARRRVIGTLAHNLTQDPTPVREAIRRCEELLQVAGSDRVLDAVITRFLALLFARAALFDESRELVRQSSLVLDEIRQLTHTWVYRTAAAEARTLSGDLAGAEHELEATWLGIRDSGYAGIDERAVNAAYALASFYCDEGRWDEARERVSFAKGIPEPPQFTNTALLRLAVEARLEAHRGRFPEALRLAERAVAAVELRDNPTIKGRIWTALGEVLRASGKPAEADAAVARAIELYEAKGNVAAAALLRTSWSSAPPRSYGSSPGSVEMDGARPR